MKTTMNITKVGFQRRIVAEVRSGRMPALIGHLLIRRFVYGVR